MIFSSLRPMHFYAGGIHDGWWDCSDVGGNLINFYTTISKYMYLFVYFNANQQQPFFVDFHIQKVYISYSIVGWIN